MNPVIEVPSESLIPVFQFTWSVFTHMVTGTVRGILNFSCGPPRPPPTDCDDAVHCRSAFPCVLVTSSDHECPLVLGDSAVVRSPLLQQAPFQCCASFGVLEPMI